MKVCEVIKKHRKKIISTIDKDDIIVENLYSQNILNERQYQIIKSEKVPMQAAEKLLDFIQYSGVHGFVKLCEVLNEEYEWLASELLVEAERNGIDLNLPNSYSKYFLPSLPVSFYFCITLLRKSTSVLCGCINQ